MIDNHREWLKRCNTCKRIFECYSTETIRCVSCGSIDVVEACDHNVKQIFDGNSWWCDYCGAEWDENGNRIQHTMPGIL